ncbi:MAG: tetratricopeptide repeat protein [Syntrophorhabdales bacterium]|jgi:tetratricopeptide (TPR) repeat protein
MVKRWLSALVISGLIASCSQYAPTGTKAHFEWLARKDIDSAKVARFMEGVRVSPGNARSHYLLGRHYYESRRYGEGIEEFRKAILVSAGYVEAYVMLGVSYDRVENFARAEEAYRAAIAISPDAAYIHNNLGRSYLLQGKYEAAIVTLKRARELEGAGVSRETCHNLGTAYAMAGHDDEAVKTFAALDGMAEAQFRMGEISAAKGMNDEAARYYARAAELDPASKLFTKANEEWGREREMKGSAELPPAIARTAPMTARTAKAPPEEEVGAGGQVRDPGMEISNGNGVSNMARGLQRYLKERGFCTRRVTNASRFDYKETTIYFRKNYDSVSQDIAAQMPRIPRTREVEKLERRNLNVKIVLGRDIVGERRTIMGSGQ